MNTMALNATILSKPGVDVFFSTLFVETVYRVVFDPPCMHDAVTSMVSPVVAFTRYVYVKLFGSGWLVYVDHLIDIMGCRVVYRVCDGDLEVLCF